VSTEAGTVHLLAACRAADTANTRTAVVIVDLAATLNAPSRILTTASAATGTRPHNSPTRPRNARPAAAGRPQPGPVEARLLDLGITSPGLLRRASGVDRLSQQVITDAAAHHLEQRIPPYATDIIEAPGAAGLTGRLPTVSQRQAALLWDAAVQQEREAEPWSSTSAGAPAETRP